MSARLFVAKLPLETSDRELREYFSQVGPVSGVILPTDRETGKKRGFAFVDFQDKADAEEAIRRLNNQMFKGSKIAVSEARPREEGRTGPKWAPARPGGPPSSNRFGREGRPSSDRGSDSQDDFSRDRPSRRSRSAGKAGAKSKVKGARLPHTPIRERRSGRFYDVGDEDDSEDIEFENIATSAPPNEEDSEK